MNRIHTNALPVEITSNRPHAGTTVSGFASRMPAKVPGVSNEALRMDLVVRRHDGADGHGRFTASARLPLPGRDIHATATDSDLHSAIVKLIEKLARRSRIRNARSKKAHPRRRPGRRVNGHRVPEALSTQTSHEAHQVRSTEWEVPSGNSQPRVRATDLPGRPAHVLLAIDYSKPSIEVTRTGAAIAAKTGSRLTFFHVLDAVAHESDIVAHWNDFPEQRRHYALARLQSWTRDHAVIGQACKVVPGRPWEEIVSFSSTNKVDLIVMGRSGSRWFGRLTARTVERVVQNASCPVLIVGQDQQHTPFEPLRVLLPTDFSADSLEAFPWAERMARWYGAQILLASVQDPMALPGTSAHAYFHKEIDEQRKQADRRLEAWRRAHLAADLHVDTRVMEGLPAPSLCRLVERGQTDLVVMSTHGAKGWVRKWLGGTTEGVLRNVTCSVLVVPPPRESEGAGT